MPGHVLFPRQTSVHAFLQNPFAVLARDMNIDAVAAGAETTSRLAHIE